MSTFIAITLLLNFIGVVQALVLAAVLFLKGAKNQFNFIIGLILVVLAVIMTNTLLSLSGIVDKNSVFQDISNSVLFLIGPLIYILVNYYRTGDRWRAKHIYHFVPFFIYMPLSISLGLSSVNVQDRSLFLQAINSILPWLWNVHLLIYLGYSYLFITEQGRKDTGDFNWIRRLVYGFSAIWFLNFILTVISRTIYPIPDEIMQNVTLFFTLVIVSIFFKSFNDPINNFTKSSVIVLSKEEKLTCLKRIKELFEEEKIYTNQDLRLANIANKIGVSQRIISKVIKHEYGKNFNEHLNCYRVNEVIRRLNTSDSLSYTIMALANKSGFKSNSAFYKAFKQQTGLTPKAYMDQHNLSNQ